MSAFKEQCITLRKQDHSLGEIMEITGKGKSTVYFHIASIPLSEERVAESRRKSGDHIKQYALARKGKSSNPFKTFEKWTPRRVLLIAHLIFDGELDEKHCGYNNRSEALIARVRDLMTEVYDLDPRVQLNQTTGVHRITYHNVALGAYLLEKKSELLSNIHSLSKDLKREFLRAFFDDEGCMDFRPNKNHRRIRGYQNDVKILEIVQSLLTDFSIESRIVLPNEVLIVGKENFIKFQKEINFSEGVRINGNRSNSVWKEHLEKREILARAIASYKT